MSRYRDDGRQGSLAAWANRQAPGDLDGAAQDEGIHRWMDGDGFTVLLHRPHGDWARLTYSGKWVAHSVSGEPYRRR